jgi:hypothetical protein
MLDFTDANLSRQQFELQTNLLDQINDALIDGR